MNVLRSHIVLMFIYAAATGVFFALLWKEDRRDRIRMFVKVFLPLFIGGVAVAWAMYPFPLR
jgi:hypothetical protein